MESNSAAFRAYVETNNANSRRRHDIAHKLGSHAPLDDPHAIALTKHCWAWFHDGDSAWRSDFRNASMRCLAADLRQADIVEDSEEWEEAMDLAFFAFNDWGEDGKQCSGLKARARQHRAVVHAQVKDAEDQILRTLCAANPNPDANPNPNPNPSLLSHQPSSRRRPHCGPSTHAMNLPCHRSSHSPRPISAEN